MGDKRPMTTVKYELEIMNSEGQFKEEFVCSYDSEFYDEDKESTDGIFVSMKMAELRDQYGNDILLLMYSVDREVQVLN